MEVLGRDSMHEAYRVAIRGPKGQIVGLVPDAVIASGMALTGGRGHQTAYEWLSRHQSMIENALGALSDGKTPSKPFNTMELLTEGQDNV